ncbi:MAG: DUF2157 domain-containing protein [Steroidobacteraceae bacterium]
MPVGTRLHRSVDRAIDRWETAGVIDAAMAEKLREHERTVEAPHTGHFARLAFGFGGLLVAAGMFLFVAANWQQVSPFARHAILVAGVVALHMGGAFGARFSPALATTLHGIGTSVLGAAIFLSGQVFHLEAHWSEALLVWALGAAAGFALLRDWPQLLWLAVLAPLWLLGEWFGRLAWTGEFPGVAVLAVAPFGTTVLSLAYLSATGGGQQDAWRPALARLGGVGLILSAGGLHFTRLNALGIAPTSEIPVPILLLGWSVALLLPLAVAAWLRGREAWPVVVGAALAGAVVMLDTGISSQRLVVYLLYATASVGLVAWGMRERLSGRVNLGVVCFLLTLVSFYYSSLFGMLGRALGLIGLGLVVLVGGYLAERGRRRLLARLEEPST